MENDGSVSGDISGEDSLEHVMETPPRGHSGIEINVGMEFSTLNEVEALYAEYGRNLGFATMRRNSRERVTIFCCYKEGIPRKRKKATTNDGLPIQGKQRLGKSLKVGCRASLHVSFNPVTELWRITKFDDVHNHEMVSPCSLKFIRGHKKVTHSAKCLSEIFSNHNIPVGKVPDVIYSNPTEAEFTRKDCYNYMGSIRRTILDVGDAQSVYEYCLKQQELNSEFRYAFQMDEFDRLKNFFWIDPRSRKAYEMFGEVISFDTTYKTNKYNMPFAPFVGIDNHMHTILFGCALLQDDANCQCKLFEYKGILCRHILIIFFENNIEQIPPQFILKRWTKDVARDLWDHPVAHNSSEYGNRHCFMFDGMYDELSRMKDGLVALVSSSKSKLEEVESEFVGSSDPMNHSTTMEHEPSFSIRDPNVSQTKGRKKNSSHSNASRIRGGLEIATSNRVRCSHCFHLGHNKRTCPQIRRNA